MAYFLAARKTVTKSTHNMAEENAEDSLLVYVTNSKIATRAYKTICTPRFKLKGNKKIRKKDIFSLNRLQLNLIGPYAAREPEFCGYAVRPQF